MVDTDLIKELDENYRNRDIVKARLVTLSLKNRSEDIQRAAVAKISEFDPKFAVPLLDEMLEFLIQELCIPRLEIAEKAADKLLEAPQLLANFAPDAQLHAITALGDSGDERALKSLRSLLVNAPPSPNTRFTVYEALSKLPMKAGGYILAGGLQDSEKMVRVSAARAIEQNLDDRLVQGLKNLLMEPAPLPAHLVEALIGAGAVKTIRALLPEALFKHMLGTQLASSGDVELVTHLKADLDKYGLAEIAAKVIADSSPEEEELIPPLVYVVDDSKTVLKMFQSMLNPLQCTVRTFENPYEAIEWAEKVSPDIMFTDLNMPEINGIELTSTLRSSASAADFPIVMVTTQQYGEDIQLALNAGVDTFLKKPFKPDDLIEAINSLTDYTV